MEKWDNLNLSCTTAACAAVVQLSYKVVLVY